jgi:peptide/nickel transport system substrate-binding protein
MSKDLTRRRFLQETSLWAGIIAGLTIIGPDVRKASAGDSIKRGGVWRLANSRTLPNLDVHRVSETFCTIGGMYDCLLDTKIDSKTGELSLVPMLATHWNYENDTRLVFTLRKGVVFHDGSKFDATVAKWNLDRARQHPKSYIKTLLKEIEDINVIDDYAIAIKTTVPTASLLYNLSTGRQWAGMASKAFHEKYGEDELARKGCGSGPFRYKDWIVDNKVILERFSDYWQLGADGKPLPYLNGLEEHVRPEIDKAVVDLRAGALDTVLQPDARDFKSIEADPNLELVKLPPWETFYPCLGFNARRGPFQNLNLRKAALFALDRERLAKMMGLGHYRVHQYVRISAGQTGWAPETWPDYSYNPEKAKDLIKADFPNGVKVGLFFILREPDATVAQIVKSMWDQVGIKTELVSQERLQWIDSMRKDTFDSAMWTAFQSMGGFFRTYVETGAPANWSNFSHPEIDKLLNQIDATVDPTKRNEIAREALRMMFETAEVGSAYAVPYMVGQRKIVKGLRAAYQSPMPHNVWLDT